MCRLWARKVVLTITASLATAVCVACGDSFGPKILPDYLTINEIRVSDEVDFLGLLEVEAHLYEAGTDRFLGCSGVDSGLRYVEESEVFYSVSAYFQKPPDGVGALTLDEVRNRNVYLLIIEDDSDACPEAAGLYDDEIGVSPAFWGSDFGTGRTMRFGNVTHLNIGTTQRPGR